MSPISRLKYTAYLLPIIVIALYITYPLLKGQYGCFDGEYEIRQPFMMNFIETLKHGELPVWNEYVGGGHPAMYFGHYPITQDTPFYMLFGVNDFNYNFLRFLNLIILFASFVCAGRILKFGYLFSLIGSLIYFSVNFVSKWIVVDTIGNLVLVYPLLIVLLFQIIKDKQWKTVLIFSLVYIFWLTGGHIVYVYIHLIMLSLIYWIAVFTMDIEPLKLVNFKKRIVLYFVVFIIPILAVLYQYYFIYDVIKASNRLKEGLIVSPFKAIVWKQMWGSFLSSSYFWMGLFLTAVYFVQKYAKKSKILPIISVLIVATTYFSITNIRSASIFADYIPFLKSSDFIIAVALYVILSYFVFRGRFHSLSQASFGDFIIFTAYISLLSYYFYSPENIIKMDYDLFMELSVFTRTIFVLCVLFSMKSYRSNRMVKIIIISLIVLYLIRSHLIIPLMRFTGIVWYPVNDGSIFSALFAILFLFGLKNMVVLFSHVFKFNVLRNNNVVKPVRYIMLMALLALLIHDSYSKFYKGHTNQLLFPKIRELAIPSEIGVIDYHEVIPALNAQLLDLNKKTEHFYRVFTSKNYVYMPGRLQDHKIREASIYESSITKGLKDFFERTILKQVPSDNKDFKNVLPHRAFAKHTLDGFGVTSFETIPYRDVYLIDDAQYLQNEGIEFFWDLLQVKYLIIRSDFSRALEQFSDKESYKLLGSYPRLDLNLYEITKDKKYSKFGILPLGNGDDFSKVEGEINSGDVGVLRAAYARIIYFDKDNKNFTPLEKSTYGKVSGGLIPPAAQTVNGQRSPTGFTLLKSRADRSSRYYEIDAKQKGMLIEFESWNRHWRLKVNKEKKKPCKAFTIFRGTRIEQGKNVIELKYNVPYFKGLFVVSVFVILTYIALFVYISKKKATAE